MKKILGSLLLLALIMLAVFYVFYSDKFFFQENNFLNEKNENISSSEIISLTNKERLRYDLDEFNENNLLNEVAEIKIDDMIANQYFAHTSPSGEEAGDIAILVGYDFIAIGENLARGNFIKSKDIIEGWMQSPEHRENILKPGYTEIGVAVKKSIYNGNETWFAVQIFGLPSWSCPETDKSIFSEIKIKQEKADLIGQKIKKLKDEIESSFPRDNQKIKEHNDLVSDYNELLKEIENLVSKYNNQVNLTNSCIESYGF